MRNIGFGENRSGVWVFLLQMGVFCFLLVPLNQCYETLNLKQANPDYDLSTG